jgi:hypothetical protein
VHALEEASAAPEAAPKAPAKGGHPVEELNASVHSDLGWIHGVRALVAHKSTRGVERAAREEKRLDAQAAVRHLVFAVRASFELKRHPVDPRSTAVLAVVSPLTTLVSRHIAFEDALSQQKERAWHADARRAARGAVLARGVDHEVVPLLRVLRLVVRRVRLGEAEHACRGAAAAE